MQQDTNIKGESGKEQHGLLSLLRYLAFLIILGAIITMIISFADMKTKYELGVPWLDWSLGIGIFVFDAAIGFFLLVVCGMAENLMAIKRNTASMMNMKNKIEKSD